MTILSEVIYEPSMHAVHFGGEIGYTEQEKFSVLAGITLNKYMDIEENEEGIWISSI